LEPAIEHINVFYFHAKRFCKLFVLLELEIACLELFIYGACNRLEFCFNYEKRVMREHKNSIIRQEFFGNYFACISALWLKQIGIKLVLFIEPCDFLSLEENGIVFYRIAAYFGENSGNICSFLKAKTVLLGGSATSAAANHRGVSIANFLNPFRVYSLWEHG